MKRVEIWTDGSCPRNPGPGGYAAVLRCDGVEREVCGFHPETTNNRIELLAVIMGLHALKRPCRVQLTTDSQYVKLGITSWIHRWRKRGWLNGKGDPVKNQDLWAILAALDARHEIEWHWVKGHAGHPENERCDKLARFQVDSNVSK